MWLIRLVGSGEDLWISGGSREDLGTVLVRISGGYQSGSQEDLGRVSVRISGGSQLGSQEDREDLRRI